jgi:hypothetical protein
MYADNVIIDMVESNDYETDNNYCFDVSTENNNNRFRVSLICYLSFMSGFIYVFINHIIYFAE